MAEKPSDAWVAEAIAAFNHPCEMGESVEDALVELSELSEEPPDDATPTQRAMVDILHAEATNMVGAQYAEAVAPYSSARVQDGRLELYHGSRAQWVPADQLDAQRAHSPAAAASDAREIWARFAKAGPDIERRFGELAGPTRRLVDVAREAFDAGDYELVDEIATTSLREGALYPGAWWTFLGEVRLARNELPAARTAIAHALLYVYSYQPLAFALMVRWLEASGADQDTLAIVYHGATQWALELKKKKYLGWRNLPKPKQLKTKFGPIYAEWIREVWPDLDTFTPDQLLHLRAIFKELAARPLADLRKQIDARIEAISAER